jgi:hypothetical protein
MVGWLCPHNRAAPEYDPAFATAKKLCNKLQSKFRIPTPIQK